MSDTTDVPFGVGCNSPVVCLQHRDAVLLGSSATETEPSQIQPGGSTGSSGCEVRGGGVGEDVASRNQEEEVRMEVGPAGSFLESFQIGSPKALCIFWLLLPPLQ